jgi:hypothetical protein
MIFYWVYTSTKIHNGFYLSPKTKIELLDRWIENIDDEVNKKSRQHIAGIFYGD